MGAGDSVCPALRGVPRGLTRVDLRLHCDSEWKYSNPITSFRYRVFLQRLVVEQICTVFCQIELYVLTVCEFWENWFCRAFWTLKWNSWPHLIPFYYLLESFIYNQHEMTFWILTGSDRYRLSFIHLDVVRLTILTCFFKFRVVICYHFLLSFFFHCGKQQQQQTHHIKLTTSAIFSVWFSSVKYILVVLLQISRTFSCCKTETIPLKQ